MDKITRKKYNIVNNAFVGVESEIYAYSIFCKYIHSMKQCIKRTEKQYKGLGLRKIEILKIKVLKIRFVKKSQNQ